MRIIQLGIAGYRILLKKGPISLINESIHHLKYSRKLKLSYGIYLKRNRITDSDKNIMRTEITNFTYTPKISIVTPVYNPDVAWIKAAIESVKNQVYENWELCLADASTKEDVKRCLKAYAKKDSRVKVKFLSENKGISGNSNEALSLATGEYIGLLDHDDELSPDALYEVVKHLQTNRDADMIYSDEDKIDLDGNRSAPFFKPDWSPDMFLSCMYTCHFGVYKKKIIDEIGGFREGFDGSQDYDLVLRSIEKTDRIDHISKILYHWRTVPGSTAHMANAKNYAYIAAKKAIADYMLRNNIEGEVLDGSWTGSYRLKRNILSNPLVSIIIVGSNSSMVEKFIINIERLTYYTNYEIIVIARNRQGDTKQQKDNLLWVQHTDFSNMSVVRNLAASYAKGEYVVFLDENIDLNSGDWLAALLEHAQRPEIGAVGAKLINQNNQIQHCGLILGFGEHNVAGYPFLGHPTSEQGYFGNITIIRNCSAVSLICVMIRKDVFEEVGGFDENLAVAFNDVDLCLKIREKGYLIVYTPYAELSHHESLSRGYEDTPEKMERFLKEIKYIREKWGEVIDEGDPYYNPNLTLDRVDFSILI